MADEPLVIPVPNEEETVVADTNVDSSNFAVAMTGLAQEAAAAAGRRINAADQLAADSQRMWSIAMTTPTVNAALGFRTATEAGSGRTRLEANRPAETSAAEK